MSEPLQEPTPNGDGAAGTPLDEAAARMARMTAQIEAWANETYQALKAQHAATHQEQLALLDPLEGVDMQKVLDALIQLNALEEVLGTINLTRNAVYQTLREGGVPEKTVRSALRIARATLKRDASRAVLDRCVALALSLLPDEADADEQGKPRRAPGDMTGEGPHHG
jgi:hypothetical protein